MSTNERGRNYKRNSKKEYTGLVAIKNILNNNLIKKLSTRVMVVEGSTDVELFCRLLSRFKKRVRIIPPFSSHNLKKNNKGEVIGIIKKCNQEDWAKRHTGNKGIFGIIDADFMNLEPETRPTIENLLITKFHDIDIEIFTSKYILEKFLNDAYPNKHISKLEIRRIKKTCLELASLFGKYVFLLHKKKIYSDERKSYHFSLKNFVELNNNQELVLRTDLIEREIQENGWSVDLNDLNSLNIIDYDKQLANSHDFFKLLWKQTFEFEEFPLNSIFCVRSEKYCELQLKIAYICLKIMDQRLLAEISNYF